MLNQRTANRRRWSHVFPMGQAEFRVTNTLTEAKPGPNWTSLVSPAVLPLTTDYLPRLERKAEYEENPYSVMLSDVDSLHGGAAAAAASGGGGGGGGGVRATPLERCVKEETQLGWLVAQEGGEGAARGAATTGTQTLAFQRRRHG